MKTAEEIVKALADWSNKYPRGRVYSMNKMSMDEELIEIENIAKEYANQSREEGSVTTASNKKFDLIKEYLDPTGLTIVELIDRNSYASLCQLLDAYLLQAVKNNH